ncbi:MAG TPA: hypothetical protein VGL02_27655, partial [Streptomyces sp.]
MAGGAPRRADRETDVPLSSSWKHSVARARVRAVRLRATAERRLPVLTEVATRMVTANPFDTGTRVAAQAFLTAIPMLFVVAAFAPAGFREQLMHSLRSFFGLSGGSQEQLKAVLSDPHTDEVRETTGAVGTVMALLSATSFSRAVARACERAWRLPRGPVRLTAWRWGAWLVLLLVVLLFMGKVRDGLGAGTWLGVPLGFVFGVGVWWWTQHLL